jgi:hypothetical protein
MESPKNGDNESSSSGNEMTAEWIVKAQLRITQPKKKAASFTTSDCGANRSTGSPCRVIYKWTSDESKAQLNSLHSEKVRVKLEEMRFNCNPFLSSSSHPTFSHFPSSCSHNHAVTSRNVYCFFLDFEN